MGSKNSEGGGGIHVDMIPVLQSLVYLQTLELYINRVVVYQEENVDSSKDGGKRRSGVGGLVKTVKSGIMIQDLVRRLNQLSTLSLRGTAFIFNTHPSASEKSTTTTANSTTADKPRFSIQHLILDTPYITEEELSTFLTQCPRLESLDLPGGLTSWTWSDAFLTTLRTSNRHLCEFSINASAHPPILEDRLVALVRQGFCRPLKRFGARACQFEEGTIFQALLDQQSSSMEGDEGEGEELEVLDISLAKRVGALFRGRLYEFLNRAKGLKRLEADGVWISLDDLSQNNEQQDAENGEQDDEEGVEEGDAAGAGITALQGQHPLLPIDQHDLETNNSTPTPTPQQRPQCPGIASRNSLTRLHIGFTHPSRSTRHLQGMYALLSTLHNLTHLQLSYTCLNLPTAESGFHQLETLSRLQVFNIETCGYSALTREDLAWMVRSWPRLEKLVLNQLGASQERAMRGWLSEFGRDDLLIETSRPSGMYF
ncbi:hypothetical protein BGX23_001527 [Mortierella sp. AD031]|nr:hypothetical protein BGX23_001527 [Mortierella sp. AD031]